MPRYGFEHIHHETTDVEAAVDFYRRLFGATSEPPFQRAGATWAMVHLAGIKITVTDRQAAPMELQRYRGYDHLALTTDDFDATLAALEKEGVPVWMGPLQMDDGRRLVFIQGPDHIKIEIVEEG